MKFVSALFLVNVLTRFHTTKGMEGRLFYLSFMNLNNSGSQNLGVIQEIFISSVVPGLVKIQYNYPLNETEIVSLDSTNQMQYTKNITVDISSAYNTQLNMSIVISAQMNISVQANKAVTGSEDGYLALPITNMSKTFYLASYTPFLGMPSMFTLISPFNDTCISLQYQNGSSGYRMQYLTMQANDVFQGASMGIDYTGVFVQSSQPIAVYSGQPCAEVPVGTRFCDHVIEQMPPINQWGRSFIMASFLGRPWPVGFRIRVVAQSNITVNYMVQMYDNKLNALMTTLFDTAQLLQGQWYENAAPVNGTTSQPIVVMVNCTASCLVMQYDPSFEALGMNGPGESYEPDPFMITVPPLNHYTNNIKFSTSHHIKNYTVYECKNFATLVAHTSDLANIYLDGIPLNGLRTSGDIQLDIGVGEWSGYSVIMVTLGQGFHEVFTENQDIVYTVFVYGYGTVDHTAYGYLGGYGYDLSSDSLIQDVMPQFDFSLPNTAVTSSPNPTSTPTSFPGTPTTADVPYYIIHWYGHYYTLMLIANLQTRFCSNGYAQYFKDVRLAYMDYTLSNYISMNCVVQGGSIAFDTSVLQYSQYTDGTINITLRVSGTGAATLNDVYNCAAGLEQLIGPLKTWVPNYNSSLEVLKNDTSYTAGCNAVHFRPEQFVEMGTGWICPGSIQTVSSSATSIFQIYSGLFVLLRCWISEFYNE